MTCGKPAGIVMISPGFYPQMGGAERQALELSGALRQLGMAVVVLTRRLPGLAGREEVNGVSVLRLPARGRGLANSVVFMLSCFLWLLLRGHRFRAVHVHLGSSPALSAALAGRLLGRRVLVKLGGGRGIGEVAASCRTLAGRWKWRVLGWLKPQLVAVTRDLVEELREHGLDGIPVTVLPNGVNTGRFSPKSAEEKAALRRQLGWGDGFCLLYVGRFSPEKQLDRFLEVFAQALREARAQASWALVGTGPQEERLKGIAQSPGLKETVRFYAPVTEVERFYAAADAFVLPSVSEGLSNALLEAMSSGLAVLASRVGGTREAVQDGVSGLLFDPGDGAAMKAALLRLLSEPGLSQALGRRAREEALARFDLSSVAKRYLQLYEGSPAG